MKSLRLGVCVDSSTPGTPSTACTNANSNADSIDIVENRRITDKSEEDVVELDKHDVIDQLSVVPAITPGVESLIEPVNDEARSNRELVLQDQAIRLPLSRLLMIYFGIGLALVLSFMDQTSVSTAAPVIGTDIGGSDSITWVGTSFLMANCAMHLVYGRLSDIFGRKAMLQLALLFLGFGNLLCGFAKTPIQLYVFRAISGLGGGGINGIAMTVVSDIVSLKDRGKYQGLISAANSLGSSIGPFAGGGLASIGQWRWVFWMTCPLSVIVAISTHFILPLKPVVGSVKTKLRQIDYVGIVLGAGATVLLLVPISGGGSAFAWGSSTVIALLVVGAVMLVAFLCSQWKLSRLPILPLRLFKTPSVSILLMQSFLIGAIYYGNIFYVPMYFQYVKGYSALKAGALVLAYTLPQAVYGVVAGQIISRTNRYKAVIVFGSCMWTLSSGLQLLWERTTPLAKVIGILQVNSLGVGFCIQTTLVAMMAVTPDKDRAVVTASRNFFRTMGGAFGLAASNAIFNNVLKSRLPATLSPEVRATALVASLSTTSDLPEDLRIVIVDCYASSIRMCFVSFTAIAGTCFALSFFIKEVTFRKDTEALQRQKKQGELDRKSKQEGDMELANIKR